MIDAKLKLSDKLFIKNMEVKHIRQGFGEGLVVAAEKDERVIALTADLKDSTKVSAFAEKFPERFIQVGVAEQALVTIASGMANYGKIPFATSYAVFSPGRNWEQVRTTICLNNVPVKIVGSHTGVNVGADGATHQMLEDIALMRVLPNMTVVVPCDAEEAKKATIEIAKTLHPAYLRLTREPSPVFTTEETPFEIGKANVLWDSILNSKSEIRNPKQIQNSKLKIENSVAIVGCGPILYEALLAAKELEKAGIGTMVINCHTIKPMDEQTVIHAAKICGAIVTVEEHQVAGGLGSAISEVLARNFPVPMEFIGMQDHFGESGKADELLEKYKMKVEDIIRAVKKVISRKQSV
jgi:transketolase